MLFKTYMASLLITGSLLLTCTLAAPISAAPAPSGSPPSDITKAIMECYHSCHGRTDNQDRFALLNCITTCRQHQKASPVAPPPSGSLSLSLSLPAKPEQPALPHSPPSESKSESQAPRAGHVSPQQQKKKRTADTDTDTTVPAIPNLAASDVDVDVDVDEKIPSTSTANTITISSNPQQCTPICATPGSSLCITNSPDHSICMNICLSHSSQWVLHHCGAAGFKAKSKSKSKSRSKSPSVEVEVEVASRQLTPPPGLLDPGLGLPGSPGIGAPLGEIGPPDSRVEALPGWPELPPAAEDGSWVPGDATTTTGEDVDVDVDTNTRTAASRL